MAYNLREKINFVGYTCNQIIVNNRLPNIKQVLAVLFYNLRRVSKDVDISAKLTIDECLIFWRKARIPTQDYHKCVTKLKLEYSKWRDLGKSHSRVSTTQKKNEAEYTARLDKLFDIAKATALQEMTDEDDKLFLINERSKIFETFF